MVAAHRVLVVDDDGDIRTLLGLLLESAGYEVEACADGLEALDRFHRQPADVVLLDVNLPELSGFATLERLRDVSDVPVILLTSRGTEIDKVRGFQAGADDFVIKPFGRQELLARIEAQLRRTPGSAPSDRYADSGLTVDFAHRLVIRGGLPVRLTPLEFRLLAALVRRAGQVVSVDELLAEGWGTTAGVSPSQVKLYVSYLRKKGIPVENVRGFGYRYAPPA
ncbi:MAG TPA: response regulator transcription factor [Gaiellaceae bacterium]|nr:response regulator transcription factor [Gaiellaceae bacterium]